MQKRISLAVVISLLLLTAIFIVRAVAQPPIFEKEPGKKPEAKYVPGEIIVKFKPGVSDEVIRDLNQRHGCSVLSISRFADFKILRIPKGKTVEEMVKIYSKNPNIDYAEPNYIAYTFWTPNDGHYYYQWHMDDTYKWTGKVDDSDRELVDGKNPDGGENGGGINVEPAWEISTGLGVIVAVIDTGVAYENYEEFIDNPGRGRDYRISYTQAPDLAGTFFVAGYDFVNNDTHPNDDEGHGTHVAGTIAQSTDNGIGVAGVAFNTSIMPVKVLNSAGSGTYADIADGIYFAANNEANVINMSLGGTSSSNTLENAVAYAYGKGVTIVCASGNDGSPNTISYPAAYDDYCIAVGATRYDEKVASYSNRGLSLDLVAPGGDLSVDQNGDGYGDGVLQQTFDNDPTVFGFWFYQGTSMAAPHVAGVAALLIANGTKGPDKIREALESTAEDKGAPGWDKEYGWGIVDAYAALNYTPEPVTDIAITAVSAPGFIVQGDLVDVNVTVKNVGNQDATSDINVTLTDYDGFFIGTQTISGSLNVGASTTLTFTWDTSNASIGVHTLTASHDFADGDDTNDTNSTTVTVTEKGTAPMVHDCNPANGYPGQRLKVIVSGSYFQDGATADFGEQILVQGVTIVDGDQLNVQIKINRKATAGPRDVTITNPDGQSGKKVGGFTVERH